MKKIGDKNFHLCWNWFKNIKLVSPKKWHFCLSNYIVLSMNPPKKHLTKHPMNHPKTNHLKLRLWRLTVVSITSIRLSPPWKLTNIPWKLMVGSIICFLFKMVPLHAFFSFIFAGGDKIFFPNIRKLPNLPKLPSPAHQSRPGTILRHLPVGRINCEHRKSTTHLAEQVISSWFILDLTWFCEGKKIPVQDVYLIFMYIFFFFRQAPNLRYSEG